MGRRDDVVAEKGVVHVISKSIDRISAQIGKSGSTMSQEDQATLDASLANALSTFDSDAHDALRESSPGKYDQALKALHYAVTLASMQRD
ncbi:hypothetical protein ASE08_24340 [Rhizobacter sp. Root16D2]|nr:hypothetical protein ASC88_27730 [Rhizobacter sp. Root29]KQW11271.1 hypothetical protein ASC98_22030 [Rhizobacter sp. Root1238]KRB18216.1 hypothetical protein ASE08_24340 [Rhizobacter sp. Root16D2]